MTNIWAMHKQISIICKQFQFFAWYSIINIIYYILETTVGLGSSPAAHHS